MVSRCLLFGAAPRPRPSLRRPARPAGSPTARVAARLQPLALILAVVPRPLRLGHVGSPLVLPHEVPEPGGTQLEGGQAPRRRVQRSSQGAHKVQEGVDAAVATESRTQEKRM